MERYGRNGGALGPRGSGSTPLPFILMHRTQRALVTSVSNCVELRAHVSSAAARAVAREALLSLPGPCGAQLQEESPTRLSLRGPCGAKHQKGIPVQYAALQLQPELSVSCTGFLPKGARRASGALTAHSMRG